MPQLESWRAATTETCAPQRKMPHDATKILHVTAKTQHNQKKKKREERDGEERSRFVVVAVAVVF